MRRVLNVLETIGGICHVVFFIAIITTLATFGEQSSASWVFGKIISEASSWNNEGVSFQLGNSLLFVILAGYDSVVHMSLSPSVSPWPIRRLLTCVQLTRQKSPESELQSQ